MEENTSFTLSALKTVIWDEDRLNGSRWFELAFAGNMLNRSDMAGSDSSVVSNAASASWACLDGDIADKDRHQKRGSSSGTLSVITICALCEEPLKTARDAKLLLKTCLDWEPLSQDLSLQTTRAWKHRIRETF